MFDALIVEDDRGSREALRDWLDKQGITCRTAPDLAAARRQVEEQLPDLALVDVELPDGSGLEVLRELGAARDTEVVMISGCTTVEAAIEALRLGARDFLTKPVDLKRLKGIVRVMARTAKLRHEVDSLRGELRKLGRFGDLVGISPAMQKVYEQIERVAPTDETVFLQGETGTGKELVAATIHRLSPRAEGPFVAVNCGAVPGNLMESQFFGHERGAFTGADRRHRGHFEQAGGGTLFLDEITEMPHELQVKLLRALEESLVTRLGGSREIEVDVRIIAATNRDPDEAVSSGKLRRDLLYRLLVFPIRLPPLREREGDVELLARTFLEQLNDEHGTAKTLSDAALERLAAHDWPGNVRELDNVLRRAHVMAKTHVDVGHLPFGPDDPQASGNGVAVGVLAGGRAAEVVAVPLGASLKESERLLIEATLEHHQGDKKAAARALGISLKTLYGRLKVYAAQRDASAADRRL